MSRENLERCFHLCARRAWGLACAMLHDPHDAADCVQQAFAAASRKPGAVPQDDPWPWFSAVLVLEVRNLRRKRRPRPMPEEIVMRDPSPTPPQNAARHEAAAELRLALDTLPEAERDAISLTYIGGLTHVQAAQALDMPSRTLSSHVSRGLERLRRRLNHREEALLGGLAAVPMVLPPGGWESALATWKSAALGSVLPGAATVIGGTIMAKKAVVAAGIVLALCVGFGGGMMVESARHSEPAGEAGLLSVPGGATGRAGDTLVADEVGNSSTPESHRRDPARANSVAVDSRVASSPRDGAVQGADVAESRRALGAWLALLPVITPGKGEGWFHGRVLHRNGNPVAGATITAIAEFPLPFPPSEPEPPIDAVIEHYAQRTTFTRSGTIKVQTDENGRWEIREVAKVRFQIRATAPGFQCEPDGARPQGELYEPGTEVNFVARPVIQIELDARLPDGTRPKSARGTLKFAGGDTMDLYWHSWWPRSEIQQAGKCVLTVRAGEYEEYAAEPVELELRLGEPPVKVSVSLTLRPGILCKVIEPPEWSRLASPGVSLVPNPPAGPVTYADLQSAPKISAGGRNREYWFLDLAPGKYRVVATFGQEVLAEQDVELGHEFKVTQLVLRDLDPAGYIVARVYSPTGQLIRGQHVYAQLAREREASGPQLKVHARTDGSHWISRLAPDAPELGGAQTWSYLISTQSEDFGKLELRAAHTVESVELRYTQPAHLNVVVPGASRHAFKDSFQATMLRRNDDGNWSYVHATEATRWSAGAHTDELRFSPIRPGSYRLQLSAAPVGLRVQGAINIVEFPIEVREGEQTQTCPLPPLHALTVRAENAAALPWLSLKLVGSGPYEGITVRGVQERMVFPALVAGEWLLATDSGGMRVNVQRNVEVNLDPRPFDCITLLGVRPGGRLEAIGLRNDDLVVAIDGQGQGSAADLLQLFHEAILKEESTWTIERQGVLLTVQVSGVEIYRLRLLSGPAHENLTARKTLRG